MIKKLFLICFITISLSADYLDKLNFYSFQASIFLPYKVNNITTIEKAYFIEHKNSVDVFFKINNKLFTRRFIKNWS